MSAGRALFDTIDRAKRALTVAPPEDDEIDCKECGGVGTDGKDGGPCIYCSGSGIWTRR